MRRAAGLVPGIAWSREFDAVAGLAAAASGIVASVVIATKPHLVGIDGEGRLRWRKEVPEPGLPVAGARSVFAAIGQRMLIWKQRLPADTRLAGDRPLVLAGHRVWVGLVGESEPHLRYLQEASASDGAPQSVTSIDDLAMFCPAHARGGVLVLDTRGGLAGFDIGNGLARLWSIAAPVATGTCIPQDGHLLAATRSGELLRVAPADGRKEILMRLPGKQVWVPPAPDLAPGLHSESTGAIEHLVSLPGGIAFSVAWSGGGAAIQWRAASRGRLPYF